MTRPDRASTTVKALEEEVYRQCMAKGRLDLLDRIREFGYETRDEGNQVVSIWVGDECALRVRLNVGGANELLN